jgi:hypothetical protein
MKKLNIVIILVLFCLLLIITQPALWVIADDDTSVDAEVTVVDSTEGSYGAWIIWSYNVWSPRMALREPDQYGAMFYNNSRMIIRLENNVEDSTTLKIWAANFGWWKSRLSVYYSADGKEWKYAGNIRPNGPTPVLYYFKGDYGDVEYIMVNSIGLGWSFGILDAVGAEGGDV